MATCSPIVTKQVLLDEKIAELIANGGGMVSLSITPYSSELQNLEQQYWRYHSPFGNPGDMIYVLEDFRIDKVCQTAEGYTVHIKYKDGAVISHTSVTPMAITAKDTFISATGAVPDIAIRLKLVIQDVSCDGENWIFTVSRILDDDYFENAECVKG